jgi:hypothetical protein
MSFLFMQKPQALEYRKGHRAQASESDVVPNNYDQPSPLLEPRVLSRRVFALFWLISRYTGDDGPHF